MNDEKLCVVPYNKITQEWDGRVKNEADETPLNKKLCCEKMVDAMERFNDYVELRKYDLEVVINLYDGPDEYYDMPINYCPWCGAKIVTSLNKSFIEKKECKERMVKSCTFKREEL